MTLIAFNDNENDKHNNNNINNNKHNNMVHSPSMWSLSKTMTKEWIHRMLKPLFRCLPIFMLRLHAGGPLKIIAVYHPTYILTHTIQHKSIRVELFSLFTNQSPVLLLPVSPQNDLSARHSCHVGRTQQHMLCQYHPLHQSPLQGTQHVKFQQKQ